MQNSSSFVDLTRMTVSGMPVYPGDTPPEFTQTVHFEEDTCVNYEIKSSMHVGTHIDGPMHMVKEGRRLCDMKPSHFFGRGVLVDARGKSVLDADLLADISLQSGDMVLFWTDWDKKFGSESYFVDFPVLSEELAHELVKMQVKLVGLDSPSPDRSPYTIHRILLQKEILIIENLCDLGALEGRSDFELVALPVKYYADSAPARVIAKILAFVPLFVVALFAFPERSLAVPPPDFIFSIGSQIAYVFSFVAILLSASFGLVHQYLRAKYHALKPRPFRFFLVLLFISLLSIGAAYWYNSHQQEALYLNWLEESEAHDSEQKEVEEVIEEEPEEEPVSDFWELNKDTALNISNDGFQALIDSGRSDYLVLDARENLENGYGRFPGSTHLRYADIRAGLTDGLPTDKFIYVLCWSGIRGEETAELLRAQGLVAIYLEDGADGWVSDYGGIWEGAIKFSAGYPDSEYAINYNTDQTRQKVNDGVILVDVREPEKIAASTIDAYEMPIMYTVTDELEAMYAQIPAGSRVITICDEYTNCFMAKVVGVELEIRGAEFLGRYNEPWKY